MKATIDRNDTTATVPGTARPRTKMSSLEESLKWWSGWSDWLGIAAGWGTVDFLNRCWMGGFLESRQA
jgi:hypothetical protein